MLTPLSQPTSLLSKLTIADKRRDFLDPDFFKPLTTGVGISCTYSAEFYAAFSQDSSSSHQSEIAMLVLEYMTMQDKARLPLFPGASDRYRKQVLPAIKEKLITVDEDDETLATKALIMNCASQIGYLLFPKNIFDDRFVLRRVSLVGMNLRGVDLHCARLNLADLTGADLTAAELIGAQLVWTNFSGANLSYADLSRTNLTRANLRGADLSGANLTGANLSGAYLTGADFTAANLTDVDLTGTDISTTDLSVTNLYGNDKSHEETQRLRALLNEKDSSKAKARELAAQARQSAEHIGKSTLG